MKEVVDALLKYNIVCKKLEKISFPTKKRVDVFLGVKEVYVYTMEFLLLASHFLCF